jgi:uncharacterized coiled-coil protein SlyX
MQVAEQVGTLEEVTAKLAERRATVAGLQREVEAATQEAAGLKNLREKFLVPASAGDAAATRHAQEIEGQQQVIGRKIEGLQIRLQTAEREVREAETEWRQLAQQAAAERLTKLTEELKTEAERLARNSEALWRQACRASYNEAIFHANLEHSGLAQNQKSQVRQVALDVHEPAGGAIFNENWQRAVAFVPAKTIHAMRPPDELQHLEVLK